MNLPIHHIGYLTKNLQKSIDSFRNLGYQTEGGITHDQLRKIDICFLRKDGYRIELVSPYGEDSVVSGLMKTHKNMPYHIAYCSENLEGNMAQLRELGFLPMGEPMAAPAFGMEKVVFLFSNRSGMIELVPPEKEEVL